MSHASPMGVNHHSPHMQPGAHMPSPNMQHMMNQGQPQQTQQHPAKNDDYNLDFLDSIPTDNDNSGAPGGSQGPGGPGSENSGGPGGGPPGGGGGGGSGGQNHHRTQAPNAGQQQPPPGGPTQPSGPGQPQQSASGGPPGGDDDFMNLLDS